MKRHISNEVLCPFYHSEDSNRVCCEGFEDDSTIHVVFQSSRKKTEYSTKYCCERYKSCKVSQILFDKYRG